MKINKLRLKGFTGIQKGLGLEEIEIDFSDISGLVAFDGANGLGKSTILENLHPYNTLASRSGALFNHVYTRNAEKELSFTYQGNQYKTLLKIDCQSGKSEGFIWKNGNSEVNGKITAYAKYINSLLGSERMFFASVFCAQNSAKLSDMTAGELKSLLSEFLNLDKLAAYEADAKERITSVTGQLEQVDKQLFVLNNKLAGYGLVKGQLDISRAGLSVAEKEMDALKKKRVEYQADIELLRDKKSKQEVLISQKANIEAKIKELEEQLGTEDKINDSELATLRTAYRGFQEEIKKNEELLKQADKINAAADREAEIQATIDNDTRWLETLTNETSSYLEEYNRALLELNAIQATITQIQHDADKLEKDDEILRLKNTIKTAESQVAILQKRSADCQSTTCLFISTALEAQNNLPKLHKSLDQRQEEVNRLIDKLHGAHFENKSKWTELATKTKDMKEKVDRTDTAASDVRKGLATLRFDLTKVKDLANKKTSLAVAQTQYDNVTRQMEENATKGKELKVKWENRKSDLAGSIKDTQVSLEDIEKQIDENIEIQIMETENTIKAVDDKLSAMDRHINETRALIMKYEADVSARAEVEYDIGAANVEKNKLLQDISDWTYLRNSCGKNGLQAMEIDGAAPIITSFAND
ncbi:MAG: hypothetical protein WC373_14635, partial [Smithella sp.]